MSKAFPIKPEYRPVVKALTDFFAKEPTAKYEEPGKPIKYYVRVYSDELTDLIGLVDALCKKAENIGPFENVNSLNYWSCGRVVAAWFFSWMSMDGGSERMRRMSAESLVEWYQRQRIYNENERERRADDDNPFQMIYELLQVAKLESSASWGVWESRVNYGRATKAEEKRLNHYEKRLDGIKRRLWKWINEREEQGTCDDFFVEKAREIVKQPLAYYERYSFYSEDEFWSASAVIGYLAYA